MHTQSIHQRHWADRLKEWMAGPWTRALHLESRQTTAPVSGNGESSSLPWLDVEPLPMGAWSIDALSRALDRNPRSRSVFGSLALVENMLVSGTGDPMKDLSPWILRQAMRQLEALADIRRERDLVSVYLHLRRAAHRVDVPTVHGPVESPPVLTPPRSPAKGAADAVIERCRAE